jgi:cytochrome c-type biogenesis protein CcsB
VASLLFLLRIRYPDGTTRRSGLGQLAQRLPDAQVLDRLAYRTTIFAFPLFGAGVILGAIWAEAAWGRFWGWDPKETTSFIAWIVYAAYLHARATAGWRETKAAWINIAGFAAMLGNLFIINIVVSGLHSYAGLN